MGRRKTGRFVNCEHCGKEIWEYASKGRRFCSCSCRAKVVTLGRKASAVTKQKLRDAHLAYYRQLEASGEPSPYKGKKRTTEQRQRMSAAQHGLHAKEKHWAWKGGHYKTLRKEDMAGNSYKQWRQAVFERDGYSCVGCGYTGYLHAHHIKPYAIYADARYEIANGQTLCAQCHYMLHLTNKGRPKAIA